jgi:chromosome partitioning protein
MAKIRPIIMAVINQKGGVGKSTTAVNLAASMGEYGEKVLLVDIDPQGNATSGFGVEKPATLKCVYDGLLQDVPASEIIIKDVDYYVDLMPATINLAGAEVELINVMAREYRLKKLLDPVADDYDFIIIDCPPSLGQLTLNGLTAANRLLVPIQCEYYALEGVTKLLETEKIVKTQLNPELEILGVLMTMFDSRTTLAQQVVDEVTNYFGELVFKTKIPRTVKLAEAPSFGKTILSYNSKSKGSKAYRDLAKEVIDRANQ